MRFSPQSAAQFCKILYRTFIITALTGSSLLCPSNWSSPAQAQTNPYCQLSVEEINQMSAVHQSALKGDEDAQRRYKTLIGQRAEQLRRCRSQTWPKTQAIWLRLYPCDARAGVLEEVLDRIVSRGYNQVYIEVFYNGQVLLPAAENRTPWTSVIRSPGYENRDLLREAIEKGRERGLKVHAWMFTMNFGYTYSQQSGAQETLARNGYGETSVTFGASDGRGGATNPDEVFIDPYSPEAKRDYYALVQAVLQRQPDGVLFDYIRYPKGTGSASVASRVQDLWIYGSSAQQALYSRALNQKGQELIYRFLSQGAIRASDLSAVNSLYPQESAPLWQGLNATSAITQVDRLHTELWRLSVAHAIQGVLDFLAMAVSPVQQKGIPAGAVFFPEANQAVGQGGGYDSRLQPWDRFPNNIGWHPMAYATCGNDTHCIVSQIQRVVAQAPAGTQIEPAIAGAWRQTVSGHVSLENQMQAIRQALPQIQSVSHFAFSWQEPEFDRDRKFCQLQ